MVFLRYNNDNSMDNELLKRAAVIRDETSEAANTAVRVGSLLVDILEAVDAEKMDKTDDYTPVSKRQLYVADWCDTHILTGNSAVVFIKATDGGAKGIALAHVLDGNTYHTDTYIPLATDKATGVMSAEDHADFSTAKDEIEQLFEMADEADKKVAANAEAIKACSTTIAALEARIAALEARIATLEAETLLTL